MGLTQVNQRFNVLTQEIIQLMNERNEETASRVQGELKAAREAMDAVYADYMELPTVLVKSAVVGNHRYSVPEFAKWADIVLANDKSFAIDPSTDYIISLAPKAKKVGGLFLALAGAAVCPTDAVDAKKEYDLLYMDGSTPVTPVEPEVTPVVAE